MEARVAFPSLEEEEEISTPTRRFTSLEITSGPLDDSREQDERQEERRLRDLRGWAKAARAVVASTPGLAERLVTDWRKAARFCAWCGITESEFREGTPTSEPEAVTPLLSRLVQGQLPRALAPSKSEPKNQYLCAAFSVFVRTDS